MSNVKQGEHECNGQTDRRQTKRQRNEYLLVESLALDRLRLKSLLAFLSIGPSPVLFIIHSIFFVFLGRDDVYI